MNHHHGPVRGKGFRLRLLSWDGFLWVDWTCNDGRFRLFVALVRSFPRGSGVMIRWVSVCGYVWDVVFCFALGGSAMLDGRVMQMLPRVCLLLWLLRQLSSTSRRGGKRRRDEDGQQRGGLLQFNPRGTHESGKADLGRANRGGMEPRRTR